MTNGDEREVEDLPGLVHPLGLAARSKHFRRELFDELGWDVDALGDGVVTALFDAVDDGMAAIDTIAGYVENPPETLEDFGKLLAAIDDLFGAVLAIEAIGTDEEILEELTADLVNYLVTTYTQGFHPAAFDLAVLLGVVELPDPDDPVEPIVDPRTGRVLRYSTPRVEVDFGQVPDLLTDPEGTLADEYLGDGSRPAVEQGLQRLLGRLGNLLDSLGAEVVVRTEPLEQDAAELGLAGVSGADVGALKLVVRSEEAPDFGAEVIPYVDDGGRVTAVVVPYGDATFQAQFGSWGLAVALSAAVGGLAISEEGTTFAGGVARLGVSAVAIKLRDPESGRALTIGGAETTRLEVGDLGVEATADVRPNALEFDLEARADDAAFVVSPGETDGFLSSVFPSDGVDAPFEIGLGWSTERGLYLRGSGGLETSLPIHRSFGGVLSLETLDIGVRPNQAAGTVPVYVAATAGVTLGPVQAVVERVGLLADLSFPEDGSGTFGPVDVDLRFKPPDGAGLSVDAAAVVGGGYLFFEPDEERYAGTLQLSFGPIAVDAVGLLTTRLPDGRPGFSLLLIVTGEFPPLQLGYGFTLNAVGGLVGINRTTAVDALQAGIRTGTLGSVLFPRDVVRNAPQIISDLRRVFPPAGGRHVFGPMARLGWGTPTVLTAELGVLLELPAPVRLVILGRLSTLLPHEDAPLVRLQMDALGVLDFDERTAAVDASLFDSRVVTYPVTGDMAMRTGWGARPGFALSVGGFYPGFAPPPGFPDLRRVSISLATGNNPRLRCAAYLAVTANSFQIGAGIDLYAGAGGFSVEGYLGFDAFLQFDPFRFSTDVRAGVALKKGRKTLAGVSLALALSGPSPWHARGKATLKLLFLKVSVKFDKKFGPSDQPAPLPPASVTAELRRAVADERNWSAQVPPEGHSFVTLREIDADGRVLVHPLADLTVRQRIVPLEVDIEKYGNSRPADGTRFSIASIRVGGGDPVDGEPVREQFAPGQFFDLSDHEKLSGEAFQPLPAGERVGSDDVAFGGQTATQAQSYETSVIDRSEDYDAVVETFAYAPAGEVVRALAERMTIAVGPMRTTGTERFAGPGQAVAVAEQTYVVARTDDLERASVGLPEGGATKLEARQALERLAAEDPDEADGLQVVTRAEVNPRG